MITPEQLARIVKEINEHEASCVLAECICGQDYYQDLVFTLSAALKVKDAAYALLEGHDNLYMAHFGPMFKNANPLNDIAAKLMREALEPFNEGTQK